MTCMKDNNKVLIYMIKSNGLSFNLFCFILLDDMTPMEQTTTVVRRRRRYNKKSLINNSNAMAAAT